MNSRKYILSQTGLLALGQLVCIGAMIGVFALAGHFDYRVILGAVVGGILAIGNFFFMAVGTQIAVDQTQQHGANNGKATIKFSYFGRILVIFAVLAAFAATQWGHPLAMVIPLLLERPILTVADFLGRKGDQ